MTPTEFVTELKRTVRKGASSTREYLENPPVLDPPRQLGEFARWYHGLSKDQRETAGMVMAYVAEGSLFELLNVLDNTVSLHNQKGRLELLYVEGESRTMLNDPDADLLYDLFNEGD